MSNITRPVTLNGEDLDLYCNKIDRELADLLYPLSEFAANHHSGKAFDPNIIPSEAQCRGFKLMVLLMNCAMSLSGTLRYDVSVLHTDCTEHDEHMERKIEKLISIINERNV